MGVHLRRFLVICDCGKHLLLLCSHLVLIVLTAIVILNGCPALAYFLVWDYVDKQSISCPIPIKFY